MDKIILETESNEVLLLTSQFTGQVIIFEAVDD